MNRNKRIVTSCLLQHDSTDCGAACLVSIVRYNGGTSTIENMRRLSGTSQSGTTLLGLYQAAEKSGLEATGYEATVDDIIDYRETLILHVTPEVGYDHYIISFGYEDERFIVWDPAKGLGRITKEELRVIWLSGKCLGLSPGKNFLTKKEGKSEKWTWLISSIKPEKELLIISVVIGLFISVLGLVMAVFTQKLLDKILPSGEKSILLLALVVVLILLIARILLTSIRQIFLLKQGKSFNIRVVDNFYSKLLKLPTEFFDSRKTGDMVARLNDTLRIQRVIAEIVGVYIIDILILLITIPMLFFYSPMAGLLSVISLPLFYMIVFRWNKRILGAQYSLMAGYAISESNFINTLGGITEIKNRNWQGAFSEKNNLIYTEFQDRAYKMGEIKVRLGLLTGIAGTIFLTGVLLYTSAQVMNSRLTTGELMAILTLCSSLLPSVINLALLSIPFNEAKVALSRMFEFTRIEPEGGDEALSVSEELQFDSIKAQNISFRFPGSKLILDNISLNIEKGKIVALIGESGCGKSTLARILLRYYDSESGQLISENGDNLFDNNLSTWRNMVGYIPQDIHIFNGTILENLLVDFSEKSLQSMVDLLKELGLTEFIDSFPTGIMTIVGEEGVNLSGGQKQILAFIRAMISRPRFLVMDEGTSSMDRDSEEKMMELLLSLRPTMGILYISHRINTIKRISDCIYLIEGGRQGAMGTHEELMQGDNLYRRFWDDFR